MGNTTRKKNPNGDGGIYQRQKTYNGKTYTYWEGRVTVGYDPATGRQIQRSVSAKTQREATRKLREITAALDAGSYTAPSDMTVGQWLAIWQKDYLIGVRPRTVEAYDCQIRNHIEPGLGAVKLQALAPHTIQALYNSLGQPKGDKPALSAKSIRNIHGILHRSLQQAVMNGYIRSNPADACVLPRVRRKELKPLDENDIARFMEAISGHRYEALYLVTLFTGMREGEVLGLTWDCVDFTRGTITVNKQLQKVLGQVSDYHLVPTKNGKGRVIAPAPFVMNLLKSQRRQQMEWQLLVGPLWDNADELVFTDETGRHLCHHTVYQNYKRVVASIGIPEARFHDLRHPNVKPRTQFFSTFFEMIQSCTLRSCLGAFFTPYKSLSSSRRFPPDYSDRHIPGQSVYPPAQPSGHRHRLPPAPVQS